MLRIKMADHIENLKYYYFLIVYHIIEKLTAIVKIGFEFLLEISIFGSPKPNHTF